MREVTPEERERAQERSRRMYQSDKESDEATVFARGKIEKTLEIARNMRGANMSVADIARFTGLSETEIERL